MSRDRARLLALGFEGFVRLRKLHSNLNALPEKHGVYVVLREGRSVPRFKPNSSAGRFKGLDPSYPIDTLEGKWVQDASIIYIGKAGPAVGRTIRKRVAEFVQFGEGTAIGHRGGRAIWQIEGVESCLLAWKTYPRSNPRQHEKALISDFEKEHGRIPFANFRR